MFTEHIILAKGGNVLGNGTWLNVGGNQGVSYGGLAADSQNGGGPYDDPDGRQSFVVIIPSVLHVLTTRHYKDTVSVQDILLAKVLDVIFDS